MANNPAQKLLLLKVDPDKTPDLVPVLEKYDWWGTGWTIRQVSIAPYGETRVTVAVVLERNDEETLLDIDVAP